MHICRDELRLGSVILLDAIIIPIMRPFDLALGPHNIHDAALMVGIAPICQVLLAHSKSSEPSICKYPNSDLQKEKSKKEKEGEEEDQELTWPYSLVLEVVASSFCCCLL